MSRRSILVVLLLSPALLVGGWLLWVWASGDLDYHPAAGVPLEPTPLGEPWFGAIHVHTDLSADATGTLEEVVAAARGAGLDFVVVSEHTRARGAPGRVQGGWRDEVLVIVAEEISTTSGHLLAFGLPPHPYALGPTARQALTDIAELGGRAVIAHPFGGESSWTAGWAGVAGVEVVSLYDALHRASEAGLIRALLAYPLNPMAAASRVLRAPSPAIDSWDERTRFGDSGWPRRIAALGAVDAHGPSFMGIPSYAAALESLQMMVWMPEAPSPAAGADRLQAARVAEALLMGRSAIVLAAQGTRPGFAFYARATDGRLAPPGAVAEWGVAEWTLHADAGAVDGHEIILRRDGQVVARATGSLTHPVVSPGTYRVEIRAAGADELPPGAPPWVLSNPVYVWPPATVIASRVYPVPALPSPPASHDLLTLPGWAAEGDPGARSAMAIGAGGLTWDLRLATVEEEDRFAGLSWRSESTITWAGREGMSVALRSAEPWRIALRVWTTGEDSTDQTWERVIPSGPNGTPVAIPWSAFRLIGDDSGGDDSGGDDLEASLDRIRGAALVVTPQRMRPGTEARIEVLRFGLYGGDG